MTGSDDPHGEGRIVTAGAPFSRARFAAVLLHGRGSSPEDILALGEHLALPDVALVAPGAVSHMWWPQSFLATLATNEPHVTSALSLVEKTVQSVIAEGMAADHIVVTGFSQGACLALEHAARSARRYRGVVAMTGGLVGTDDVAAGFPQEALYGHMEKVFNYAGDLEGMPVSISCRTRDPHIPLKRVEDTAKVFAALGAEVSTYIEPGSGHSVMQQDVRSLRLLLNPR